MKISYPYPGIRVTTNGNQWVSYSTENRLADHFEKGTTLLDEGQGDHDE